MGPAQSCLRTAWSCPSRRCARRSSRRPCRSFASCGRAGRSNHEGRFFNLREAYAYPAPEPPPRIIIGGEKPAGARLAARAGDGWTTNAADYERLLPIHLEELSAHGRSRAQMAHLLAVDLARDEPLDRQPLIADMAAFAGGMAGEGRRRAHRQLGSAGRAAGAARGG